MAAKRVGLSAFFDIRTFSKNVRIFNTAITSINKKVLGIAKAATGLGLATKVLDRFGLSWRRIADIVTGVLIIGVFRKISAAIRDMTQTAVSAVSTFQSLRIQFEALAARDLAKELGISTRDALLQVNDQARELLLWVRKIAVSTPFSVETLSRAIAYGQAFGFTIDQAKRLTIATGQFTAGMGLTNEVLERIVWNFGQMLASGRVLGRELRDLANNFVPVADITALLAERAEVTFTEMQDLMSEGTISAEAFIGAFVTMAETDFPNAMERMSRTVQGVRQNIQDFIETLLGMELLGPLFDVLASSAADFLDSLFNESVLRSFTAMGSALLIGFQNIRHAFGLLVNTVGIFLHVIGVTKPTALTFASIILKISLAVEFLVRALRKVIISLAIFAVRIQNKIGTTFGDLASESGQWGANIVISFAQGMAQAISYVISVIRQLAQVITGWLKGSSPPKLLPNLDWWGRAAMETYLEGWLSADFKIFDKISSIFTNFIRSLGGKIDEEDIIPRILGSREGIAAAIKMIRETGTVSEKALETIFKSAGIASESIQAYVKSLFELEAISVQVANVQKFLGFSLQDAIPVDVFGQVVDSLTDLENIVGQFGGDIGASLRVYVDRMHELSAANLLVAQSQEILNNVIKVYDDRLADLRRQQAKLDDDLEDANRLKRIDAAISTGMLTAQEKLRLELEKRGILLRRNIRDTEEERKVVVGAAQVKLDAAEEAQKVAEEAADRQRTIALELAEAQLSSIKEQVDANKALIDIQTENNRLLSAQIALLERLAEMAKKKGAGDGDPFDLGLDIEGLGELDEDLLSVGDEIRVAVELLEADLRKQMEDFVKSITAPFSGIGAEIDESLREVRVALDTFTNDPDTKNFGKVISENVDGFLKNWKKKWPLIAAIALTAWTVIKKAFETFVESIKESFADIQVTLGITGLFDWERMWTGFTNIVGATFVAIGALIVAGLAFIAAVFGGMARALEAAKRPWENFKKAITRLWSGIWTFLTGIWNTFKILFSSDIKDKTKLFVEEWRKMAGGIKDIVSGLWDSITASWDLFWTFVVEGTKGFIDTIVEFFEDLVDKLVGNSIIPDLLESMLDIFTMGLEDILTAIGQFILDAISAITGKVQDFLDAGKEIISNLLAGIKSIFLGPEGVIAKVGGYIVDTIAKIRESVLTFLEVGKELFESLLAGIKETFFAPQTGIFDKLVEFMGGAIDAVLETINDWVALGASLIEGILKGLKDNAGKLWTFIKNLIISIITGSFKETESKSPSKVFAKLGASWIQGLVLGAVGEAKRATNTLTDLFGSLTDIPISSLGLDFGAGGSSLANGSVIGGSTISNTTTHIDRSVSIEMTPTYQDTQSPAQVRDDLSMALTLAFK